MSCEVRVKLKSIRFEVEASLFSDEEVREVSYGADGTYEAEPEIIEINTLGQRSLEQGRVEFSYEETEATGMAGSHTAMSFLLEHPGVISMTREGTVSTALVFEEGKRHHCLYQTPYMPFEVCVHTLKVDNRLIRDKVLELDYIIEIRGARAERTKFRMEVL